MAAAFQQELDFENLVELWEKINKSVPARPLIHAIFTYCLDVTEPLDWNKIFNEANEQERVVNLFRDRMGVKEWTAAAGPAKGLSLEEQLVLNYLKDTSCKEFAFIATIMMKFYDMMYAQSVGITASDVVGDDAAKALGNLATSSLWLNPLSEIAFMAEVDNYGPNDYGEEASLEADDEDGVFSD